MSPEETPILNTLQDLVSRQHTPFYAPGHKRGQGIPQALQSLFGKSVFSADLPELPELDNLFAPEGVIAEAQQLASLTFGAEKTWFLVNGSTCGIIASILATCGTGDKIILPRNIHQSAISGLILSGAIPIFLNPEYDSELDIAYSITPAAVAQALSQHPDTKAVLMLYPTYQGVCGDISSIAQITHDYNIPLLVDEAHGAHFHFHPELPISALNAGADLTVQSTHKTLGAMTQASMLHLQGQRIDPDRISKALQLLQSTSPSYLLLASLDAARQQMALQGQELMTKTLKLAQIAREKIAQISGITVLNLNTPPFLRGVRGDQTNLTLDPTRLTLDFTQIGLTGFDADEILHNQLGITAELPLSRYLTFIISIGNTENDIENLIEACQILATRYRNAAISSNLKLNAIYQPLLPQMSPREAFFAPSYTLPLEQTLGKISAELICPYPPGIPILMPGETITEEALIYLQQVLKQGARITGCSDSSCNMIQVIQ